MKKQDSTDSPRSSSTQSEVQSKFKEKELFEALLKLKTVEDYRKFFIDLCTPSEIEVMADRWGVAQLLDQDVPYREIYNRTGVSTATITRVARCLVYGEGYRLVIERSKEKNNQGKITKSKG